MNRVANGFETETLGSFLSFHRQHIRLPFCKVSIPYIKVNNSISAGMAEGAVLDKDLKGPFYHSVNMNINVAVLHYHVVAKIAALVKIWGPCPTALPKNYCYS